MPVYVFKCDTCGASFEELYPVKDLDNKDSDVFKCRYDEEKRVGDDIEDKGTCELRRVPTSVAINFFGMLTPAEQRKAMAKRARENLTSEDKDKQHEMNKPEYKP